MTTTSFADTLKELRNKAELTQSALCKKMGGFAQPLLCRYETGKATPGPNTRIALANALGVEVKDLNIPEKPVAEANGNGKTKPKAKRTARRKVAVEGKSASVRRRLKAQIPTAWTPEPMVAVSASTNKASVSVAGVTISGTADAVLAAVKRLL